MTHETEQKPQCGHPDFRADVAVNRLLDSGAFMADIRIRCADCGLPFEFVGVTAGLSGERPMCDPSAQELRAPIRPKGSNLLPGIPGFTVRSQ